MVFKFGVIAADRSIDIQIYYVTAREEDAALLADRFLRSGHRIQVSWVKADLLAASVIHESIAVGQPWSAVAVILDYGSYGNVFWDMFWAVRNSMGERYVEYVVFGCPEEDIGRSELQSSNVTVVPAVSTLFGA